MFQECEHCGWELENIIDHEKVCRNRFGLDLENEQTIEITKKTYNKILLYPTTNDGPFTGELKENKINTVIFKANDMDWRMILYKKSGVAETTETRALQLCAQIGVSENEIVDPSKHNVKTAIGFNISIEVDDTRSLINRHATVSSENWSAACGNMNISLIKCSLLKSKSFIVKISPTKEFIPRNLHSTDEYRRVPGDGFSVYGPVYRYVCGIIRAGTRVIQK